MSAPLEISRGSANFDPSSWKDYFLRYDSNTMEMNKVMEEKVEELKEGVKNLLQTPIEKHPSDKLILVDSIQRLGISYHFESEIDEILEKLFQNYVGAKHIKDNEHLYTVSLQFRLLRQQGYHISCDVFNKFKDTGGNFKEILVEDVRGMLSLYEASHLRMHGESILDEALHFTTFHLKAAAISNKLSPCLEEEVKYALNWPIHLGYPRLNVRSYISVYQKYPSHNKDLLTFAKIDFNILQKLYQKELSEVTKWWTDSELEKTQYFARSRTAECYLWALGLFYEPKYSVGRKLSTKLTAIVSIMDDIYDSYGSFEELQLLTDAINRWENNNNNNLLPEFMKVYLQNLISLYDEIEQNISKEGKPYLINHAKEAMKRQARSYLDEAKWLHEGNIPTIEEYLKVSVVSTCYYLFIPISFIFMGDLATKYAFEWVDKYPKILEASGILGRLMNDIVSRKFEHHREHIPSAVECYMKQYGVSEHEAMNELDKQLVDAWKNINKHCIKPTELPLPLLMRILNLARTTYFFYKDEDSYTHAKGAMKEFLKTLLVDAIRIS